MPQASEFSIAATHPALPGHFPGRPVVPGVLLLANALEAALALPHWAARIGAAPRLALVKFPAPVLPGADGATLRIRFDDLGTRVRFEVSAAASDGRAAASGEWIAVPLQASPA